MIEFAHPLWLMVTVLLVAGLTAVLIYGEVKRREILSGLANPKLLASLTSSVSGFRRRLKEVLFLASVLCFGVAMARPQMGYRWEEIRRKGIDILFAIDTSRSMLVQDVRPSRLERSKLAVIDFSRNFNGGRLGLVPFAGSAFLMCPLTLDTGAFYESLESLDTNIIGRPGTDIGSAIREASQAFSKGSGDEKVLVLITDGEDLEGDAVEAAKEVAQQGVKIYAVGVGTSAGELIPDFQQGGVAFVKDESGNLVKSRLDEKVLKEIASLTGGSYYPLGPKGEGLEAILRDNRHLMKELEIKESMRKVPLEQFQWPLLAGLILLLVETLIRERKQVRRAPDRRTGNRSVFVKNAAAPVLGILVVLTLPEAGASVKEAEKNMKSGRFAEAMGQYGEALKEEPGDSALLYNKGVAAFRAKDYTEAARAFEEVRKSRDLSLQKKAYYNLGNTLFRAGELTEKSDRDGTIKQWESALSSYEGALALEKADKEAQFNHDLVRRRLEELKKNPPPPKDQDKKQQDQQQDQKKDQNKDQGPQDKKDQEGKEGQDKKEGQGSPENKAGDQDKKSGNSGDKAGQEESSQNKEDPAGKAEPKEAKPGEPGKEPESEGKAEPLQPGQMTKEEAKALLNAAKAGQKPLLLPITRGKDSNKSNPNRKNW